VGQNNERNDGATVAASSDEAPAAFHWLGERWRPPDLRPLPTPGASPVQYRRSVFSNVGSQWSNVAGPGDCDAEAILISSW